MQIGYARVSTVEQSLDLQREALVKAGCDQVFEDTISGSKADRPGLAAALAACKPGDTFTVWKLDRLGRSMQHLVETINEFRIGGIMFRSLTDAIDTTTTSGEFMFHVIAAMAHMERALIRERTLAGLASARAQGRTGGRRHLLTPSQAEMARDLKALGRRPGEIAEQFGVSVPTLYRYLAAGHR